MPTLSPEKTPPPYYDVNGDGFLAPGDVLIVVDQFEELFTLCRPEIQTGFAELLGRLAEEADVRMLLVLRDDFLDPDGVGPRRVASFIQGGLNHEIQADVAGFVAALLNAVRGR